MSDSAGIDRDLFRLAVDLSPAGIIAVDADGRILLANREVERLFGYSRDDLIGERIETLIPVAARAAHPAHRADFARQPSARRMGAGRDLRGLRRDGSEVPLEIGLNPIDTPGGPVVLASVVDISERRAIEEKLRQSQKMEAIGTLAGGIAHDFNNLLFGIVGYSQLALDRARDDQELRENLARVLEAAERGRQLVQRILAFSRQREAARAPIALEKVLREALQLLRASLPSTIEIVETIDPATPKVTSDDTQVHQILMNLATNAAHAMPQGGHIEVRVGPFEASGSQTQGQLAVSPGPYARLTVVDSGHGMSPEVVERALEPFFTTKPVGEGTGLGLSIIHGIVRAHGGAIEIQSRPGQGTRVDVYLPAHRESAEDGSRGATPYEAAHVLVVEDEDYLRLMLEKQIAGYGYRVTAHGSSVDALEDFRSRPRDFDLLVTDNTMPKMTGLALAREVVRLRPELPVLLISGLAENADLRELEAFGVRMLLPKPSRSAELEQAIRTLLGA